jgi:hypothetical protein
MSFFGAVFASMTLRFQFHRAGISFTSPFLIFAGIAAMAAWAIRQPGRGIPTSERASRVIMWSSIGEGIGLFIAVNIVVNLHHSEMLLPTLALVVGAHFFPVAYAAPFPPFYVLGIALLSAAAFGFGITQPRGGEIAGFASAIALWIAAVVAIRRDLKVKSEQAASNAVRVVVTQEE